MDKRLGSSAGILALVALLLHTFALPDAERSTAPSKPTNTTASAATGDSSEQVLDKQGPWRATQQYFHNNVVSNTGRACQNYLLGLPAPKCSHAALLSLFGFEPGFDPANLRFLLATIADPMHTRMSIETDRDLDAIQRAAFRSGWELATQWLPWTAKLNGAQEKASSAKADTVDLETFPGVLVFRRHFEPGSHSEQLLVVLVAAETPTAGVNGFQFEGARRLLTLLADPAGGTVFIAGPRYSGSFLSLTKLLEQWPAPEQFILQAGSVSNSDYARAMLADFATKQRARKQRGLAASSITFHGSTLPSVAFEHQFASLLNRLHLRPDQAARLIEDETGFSVPTQTATRQSSPAVRTADAADLSDAIPVYRYPRDIAQVRNNYNDAAFAPPSAKGDSIPVQALEFSLKDTQAGEDIFPMFSTTHTPVSQNAELQQTIHYLRRQGVRIASLSATNVFDTIFLANVVARTCPDLRIVLRGPDLLFVQEASAGSLSGLLAISPFPIFPEGAVWSNADRHDMTAFASADQVGEYNAVVNLLRRQSEVDPAEARRGGDTARAELEPYQQSFDDKGSVLSAWLLELSPTGWLPIDLLPQVNPTLTGIQARARASMGQDDFWFDRNSLPATHAALLGARLRIRPGWILLCGACALFTLLFCGRLIYLYLNPDKLVWSNLCIVDIRGWHLDGKITPVIHHRYICMVCCFSTLLFLNGLLLCPMLSMRFHYQAEADFRIAYLLGSSFLATLAIAICLSVAIPLRIVLAGRSRIAWESIAIRAGVLVMPFFATYLWWVCCNGGNAGFLLCFRTFSLDAPLAPVWPLFISGFGLFSLCYFHLRRFTWAYRRQPHLDTSAFDHVLPSEFGRLKDSLENNLYRLSAYISLPLMPKSLLAGLSMIVVLYSVLQVYSLNSVEPFGFTQIFEYLQVPLAVFTLVSFGRFLRSWSLLRAFLVSLNSVVLGRFFERIPEFGGNGPVWIREMKFISLASAVNSVIALRNLRRIGFRIDYASSYLGSLQNFLSVSQHGGRSRLKFIRRFDAFRRRANAISADLSETVLRPFWGENILPYVGFAGSEIMPAVAAKSEAAPPAAILSLAAAAGSLSTMPNRLSVAAEQATVDRPAERVSPEAYEFGSKYVALQYSLFIGYVLLHLQNLLLCSTLCFVFIVVALNSFVFAIPQVLSYILCGALLMAAVAGVIALAQLERDPILSRLSGTQEGVLGKDFYWRAIAYGALPVVSILGTQFPAISRFLTSWVAPALSKLQ